MKTVIFDFNGTLLDDRQVCLDVFNIMIKERNLKEVSMQEYLDMFRFPVREYYEEVGFSKDDFDNVGNEFHEHYNRLSPTQASVFDSAYKILEYLKNKGYYLVCLSASMESTLIKQLKYYKIYDYFNDIIGLNNNRAVSKLDVAIKYMNDKKLDPNECLFIGDSIHDLEVANGMNVKCYLISTGHTSKKRLQAVSDLVIDDLLELKNIL